MLNRATESIPGPETIVALDTEFVSTKEPEIQINPNGESETIRPVSHALARVSVIRGQGEKEGEAFIDDYIAIKEPIVDYLTTYSGITKGDLDPRTTRHNLVSLKMAYKKLWVLLNLGCKFLGHSLSMDFRVINIRVPQGQIIDTADLYMLRNSNRKLSLSFLAWCVLKEDIQIKTHDSIEDARTALKLYRKYLEYDDAGIMEPMLAEIAQTGKSCNFRPPRREGFEVKRTLTPPIYTAAPTPGLMTPAPTTPTPTPRSRVGLGYPIRSGGGSSGFGGSSSSALSAPSGGQ